jgi:hypothetical protein
LELKLDRVDVRRLASEALAAYEAQAHERGVALECRVPETLPPVRADALRLQRVIGSVRQQQFHQWQASAGHCRVKGGYTQRVARDAAGVGLPNGSASSSGSIAASVRARSDEGSSAPWAPPVAGHRARAGRSASRPHLDRPAAGGAAFRFSLPLAN